MSARSAAVRKLVTAGESHVVAGAYDALTAKLAAAAGFEVVYMSGYGVSAGLLGLPDVGLATLTEVVQTCGRMCAAVDTPIIADADTGYGGASNVYRTVQAFEAVGAAGVHLEDQEFPKRCGQLSGKRLIDSSEMVAKLTMALEARTDPDFLVIARTDAIAVEGIDRALARAETYGAAGADMVFVDAPQSLVDVERIARELRYPLVFDWSADGVTPPVARTRLEELGYVFLLFPDIVAAVHRCVAQVYARLRGTETLDDLAPCLTPFAELNEFLGLGRWIARDSDGRS
jgi:2,3-dimethylmalate lyase